MMQTTDLMNTNTGDEHHQPGNWQDCPACGYDNPHDYTECTFCGATLVEADA